MCRIDKLMWVFYKNGYVKYKKHVFSCKMDRNYASTNANALISGRLLLVIIKWTKKNFSIEFKLEPITTYYLWFNVKAL